MWRFGKTMRRRLLRITFVAAIAGLCIPSTLTAQEQPAGDREYQLTARDVLLNTLLPGTAQIKLGRVEQGLLYLSAVPLTVAGTVLQSIYFSRVLTDPDLERFVRDDTGRSYIYYLDGLAQSPDKWQLYLGTVLGLYGSLLTMHSQYDLAYHVRRQNAPSWAPARPEPLTLGEVVAAPWVPGNLINIEIFPVFLLSILPDLSRLSQSDFTSYFAQDTVPFLGTRVSPGAGLALAGGSAILIANANAVWEEIAYRGMRLNTYGVAGSAVRFGLVHLPNALVPNTSIQDTIWQSLFATMFGLYAGSVTENNNGDFRNAIAWHFWNNVLAFTFSYLAEPESQLVFRVGVDVTY